MRINLLRSINMLTLRDIKDIYKEAVLDSGATFGKSVKNIINNFTKRQPRDNMGRGTIHNWPRTFTKL